MMSSIDGNTSSVNKTSLNFNCMDPVSSVNNFQSDRGPALSYWKPAKKVVTHDPFTKNKAPSEPLLGELEYYPLNDRQFELRACSFVCIDAPL